MQVEHWDTEKYGPLNEQAMRDRLETYGYSVSRYVYSPGTYFSPHTHHVDKVDGVLSGKFKMSMGKQSVILEAGDTLVVPQGTVHSAEVVGNEPVVSLDAIRFR